MADPHPKLPRSYQWNIAIEQPLGSTQTVSATYIGAIGRGLLRETQLANVSANFPSVSYTSGAARSGYHALQLKYQRRVSRGLQGLASYSFSHSIDSSSTDAFATRLNTPAALGSANIDRGDSDYDIRHGFTAGLTYDLPSPRSQRAFRFALGGWSADAFLLARSAPPVDLIGTVYTATGVSVMPRPDILPGQQLELEGTGYPGAKFTTKPRSRPRHPVGRATSGATRCADSEPRKQTSYCSVSSGLRSEWECDSAPSSSIC